MDEVSREEDVQRIAEKLLMWEIVPGANEAFYRIDHEENVLHPYDKFRPFDELASAHLIIIFLLTEGWTVTTCWGPVTLCIATAVKTEDLANDVESEGITVTGSNLCEAIGNLALGIIDHG